MSASKDRITFCGVCRKPVALGPHERLEACAPGHPGSPGHIVFYDPPAYVERARSVLTDRPIVIDWPVGLV